MKKFTFKNVLDGFRSSVANQPTRVDQEIVETLRSDNFQVAKTFRHGFPFQPTAVAFDPIQRLLAVGTKTGSLRVLGRPGVDAHLKHDGEGAVIQIQFLTNEGALITATSDDVVHLWNFRQKKPEVVHSLKFQRERITCLFLPLQSKWFYVGTEKGNIHVVNIETFVLSGYIINWNKAIEVSRKTHPGSVVHLSDNPQDPSKLLIGYETGQIVLWDLRTKAADMRWNSTEPLRSVSWHHEGKQFICSHTDGSLTTWNVRQGPKPVNVNFPHAKANKDGKLETCKPIQKVEWKSSRATGEAYVIFSGGLPYDKAGRTPSISVVHGKTTTVLEMEQNVVDFMTLCENPYASDFQDPYAIVVLLNNDLVVIDLLTPGYPCYENPYPMDLHESPVTCCTYLADCPSDLIPAFYSVGSRTQKRLGFSEREWPVGGGEWSPTSCSYNEIILTGHADGSIKFWDASAGTLQILYKLKTAKVFEKPRSRGADGAEDDPFAIQLISLCPESRKLCIAGASAHVVLFKFKKLESTSETYTLEIPIVYETSDEPECSPEYEYPPRQHISKGDSAEGDSKKSSQEAMFPLKVKQGPQKKQPGFQAHIVCLTPWVNGEQPGQITALSINSSYGLMAYGNEVGIVVIDIVQKVCLLNMGTPDLYGNADPYQRVPRSPKRAQASESSDDRCRSPTADQTPYSGLLEPPVPDVTVISLTSPAGNIVCDLSSETDEGRRSQTPYGFSSANVSPQLMSPVDAEEAEDAFVLLPDQPQTAPAAGPDHPSDSSITSLHSLTTRVTIAKKASQTWKGFSLKKQLNRVKKNSLLPNKEKPGEKSANLSPSDESSNLEIRKESSDPPPPTEEDCWTILDNSAHRLVSEKNLDSLSEPSEEGGGGRLSDGRTDESDGRLDRPVDLPLFDSEGRPVRPARHQGPKKKLNPDLSRVDGGKRDTRLLSVPNLKHQKQDQPSLRDLRRKQQAAGNQPSFGNLLIRRFNKLDSSFSRSRSSSMSSLENISSEAIQCLAFADSYTKKSDPSTFPTLWIGTSLGSVLTVMISLPPSGEQRMTQPVVVSPWGTIFRLKGCILTMSFLDCNGALIPYSFEPWKDENKQESRDKQRSAREDQCGDRQFVVIVSEKQSRVVALPSHNCVYRQQLADTDFVVKAEIISLKDSVCLVCYISSGHITAYSLPSLRPLIDVDFLPLAHLSFQTSKQGIVDPMLSIWGQQMFVNEDTDQIARTFCFSNRGHGLYLCSPSEIQKFTVSSEFCSSLNELVGELFLPHDMPEPPKASFFQGLFGGGVRQLDREELFGENSGKPSRSVAKHIPGPSANIEAVGRQVTSVTGEVNRAHKLMLERGEKLGELEERTQRMMNESENFANSAHQVMLKYKDKKWYQL